MKLVSIGGEPVAIALCWKCEVSEIRYGHKPTRLRNSGLAGSGLNLERGSGLRVTIGSSGRNLKVSRVVC